MINFIKRPQLEAEASAGGLGPILKAHNNESDPREYDDDVIKPA